MTQVTTQRTSSATMDIIKDFVIDETQTTRRIFKATIVDNHKDSTASVAGHIIYQRKGVKQEWDDISEIKLSELRSGDGIKFNFSCSELKKFSDILDEVYAIGNKGISSGTKNLVVLEASKLIEIPAERKQFIKDLLDKHYGVEIWEELVSANPDLATKLANSKIQMDREKSLNEFEESMKTEKDESYWQHFFENNQWIFGYGLKYQFLHLLQEQPNYGGTALTGKGAQKGDFLMHSAAENKFTVIVEIKKPSSQLFGYKKGTGEVAEYRNGVPWLHYELVGAISQVQVNCKTWETEGATNTQNQEALGAEKIFTHEPKGILVIGHTRELDNYEKRKAFELYRRNINNPEIITFDEIYERAKYIVGIREQPVVKKATEEDDRPF